MSRRFISFYDASKLALAADARTRQENDDMPIDPSAIPLDAEEAEGLTEAMSADSKYSGGAA